MVTVAEHRRRHDVSDYLSWLVNGLLLVLVVHSVWRIFSHDDTPVSLRFWHGFANYCYRQAYQWGRLGMAAETSYWQAVQKVRP